jgi:DNA-binding MarR family transcriptional regulator
MSSAQAVEETTRDLMGVLPLVNRLMSSEMRRLVGEDTTMPQFRVLAYLHEQPMTVSALAKKRRVSLQSAGELVQTLVERGWVIRKPDPLDRRQSLLELTRQGRTQFEQAQTGMLKRLMPYVEMLSEGELVSLRRSLAALNRVLGNEMEDDSDGSH